MRDAFACVIIAFRRLFVMLHLQNLDHFLRLVGLLVGNSLKKILPEIVFFNRDVKNKNLQVHVK